MRMQWEDNPHNNNPDASRLHTTERLPCVCDARLGKVDGWRICDKEKPLSGSDRELISRIVAVRGITEISISESDQYAIYVKKARMFDWSDIKPQIELILGQHFPTTN